MKIFTKIIIVVLLLATTGGYWYWQKNKKHFVKDSIDNALKKKTDSLYYIHYDSSKIDAVDGDASFFNVSLQSDSIQKEILKSTDSLPNTLYNIHVAEVKVVGVDMAGLLENENVAAKKIFLNKPIVQIINTGSDKAMPSTYNDTLELYKRILGQFKSIHADTIRINNGTVLITDKNGKALTTLENINVELYNFLVDSTHDYKNIISYFIKDVKVTVDNIQLPESDNNTRINIGTLIYDAPHKILHIGEIQQYKTNSTQPLIDLKNININALNTDAFILNQQLRAGMVTCDGGLVTIYKNGNKAKKKNPEINFSSDIIDEVEVDGMNLSNTKIIIIDTSRSKENPFVLNDVKFAVSKVYNVTDGSKLSDIINNAAWQLSLGSLSFFTKDKLYNLNIEGVQLNNVTSSASIKSINVQPQFSEEQFARKIGHQQDRYDFVFNDILLEGINFKKLINDNMLEINQASVQPILKIFNDRTAPRDTSTKISKYPNQQLSSIRFPFYIKKLHVNNGYVAYKERSKKSLKAGTVFFSRINAMINNITNIKERVKANEILTLNATALFMGVGKLTTQWKLPMNTTDTMFNITGNLGQMNTVVLNSLVEPLAMVSVKKGNVKKLDFTIHGGNYRSTGNILFFYNDLNISVLKKDKDDQLRSNSIESLLANAAIKNKNPVLGENRLGPIDCSRDTTKSFFNFLWKSVLSGVKKTVL